MKKILLAIVIVLLCVIAYNSVANGYKIGNLEVLGIKDIKANNDELDQKIEEANRRKTTDYTSKLSELNSAAREMTTEKKNYEALIAYTSQEDIEKATKFPLYNVEVLWTRIGLHATQNGVKIKLEILANSNNIPDVTDSTGKTIAKYTDLKFTATGRYINITDFIADLEKDAKLAFTIENFELVPASTQDTSESGLILQASFKVKDIALNADTTNITTLQT